jgi:hypothetical protein
VLTALDPKQIGEETQHDPRHHQPQRRDGDGELGGIRDRPRFLPTTTRIALGKQPVKQADEAGDGADGADDPDPGQTT